MRIEDSSPVKKPRGVKSEYLAGIDLLTDQIEKEVARKELEEKQQETNKSYQDYTDDYSDN